MSEGATNQQTTAQPPVPPTAPPPVTPPQAGDTSTQTAPTAPVTVDMAQIEKTAQERAERAAQAVVKEMLTKQGLDEATVKALVAEYKEKLVTPEQAVQNLTKERDEGFAERDGKIAMYEQREILRGHGLSDAEEIEIMSIRIERLMTSDKDFAASAKDYFEKNPLPTKPPATVVPGVTGNDPMTKTEADELQAKYTEAQKNNDSTELVRLIRIAAGKGVTLKG